MPKLLEEITLNNAKRARINYIELCQNGWNKLSEFMPIGLE
jgi:hypothetical protein